MAKRNIFLTEEQLQYIEESQKLYHCDPRKVLLVKNYLDKGFKKAKMDAMGEDGYPKEVKIVGMIAPSGEIMKNMTAEQLFYLLQDRFSGLFSDKDYLDRFLKKIMGDWYEDRINRFGISIHKK